MPNVTMRDPRGGIHEVDISLTGHYGRRGWVPEKTRRAAPEPAPEPKSKPKTRAQSRAEKAPEPKPATDEVDN